MGFKSIRKIKLLNYLNTSFFKNYSENDILPTVNDYEYDTPMGKYLILSDEEADGRLEDIVTNMISEIGLSALEDKRKYIEDNFLLIPEDLIKEEKNNLLENKQFEDSRYPSFENKMIEYIFLYFSRDEEITEEDIDEFNDYLSNRGNISIVEEQAIYSDEVFILSELYDDILNNTDTYIDKISMDKNDFISLLDEDYIDELLEEEKIQIDTEGLVKYLNDSRGTFLSPYDGKEREYEGYYIYKTES